MNIHINKGGRNLGAFPIEEVNRQLQEGLISLDDLAWHEGIPEWRPLRRISGVMVSGGPLPPPLMGRNFQNVNIPNYLVPSIIVTLICCLPAGIASIIYAAQVNTKIAAGDLSGARDASTKAKIWCCVSFGIGLVSTILYILAMVFASLAGRSN